MSANQKIILTIFVIYLALNAIIGIVFSKRQGSKQNVSSEKKFFIGGRNMNGLLLAMTTMATYTSVSSFISMKLCFPFFGMLISYSVHRVLFPFPLSIK